MESYQFSQLKESQQNSEFERLKQQALIFWKKESALLSKLVISKMNNGADIGCGHGFVSSLLTSLNPELQIKGIDISVPLIEAANEYHRSNERLSFSIGSAYETGLEDSSQDFVYSRLLYQHLDQPQSAANEAFRICAPGGEIAILDLDAQLQLYSEELPAVSRLLQAITDSQRARGGNREIGRKLPVILQEAGFKDISLTLEPISTLDVPLEMFAAITMGFAEWFITDDSGKAMFGAALQELKSIDRPLFGLLTVMFVTGKKPT